ncbi:MAG: hypothetical protein HC840_15280 [Leptolyngbyaceae cyanobacterium RM2_2_4]|nr:hypothetical protein [Leptolyngbyaceae cyanobacterium RM2_2_4]
MTAFRFLWSWLLVAPVAMGAVIAASSAIAADTPTAAQLDYSAMEEGRSPPKLSRS